MNLNYFIQQAEVVNKSFPEELFIEEDGIPKNNLKENRKESYKSLNQTAIIELQRLANIKAIEVGIIKFFLREKNIKDIKNRLLLEFIESEDSVLVEAYLQRNKISVDFEEIEKLFELLISSDDKRVNGAVYTPLFVVNYIVNNTINKEGIVCDCSCGCGVFLIGALKRLKAITNKSIIEIIENYLYGIDILEFSIRRTKIILTIYALINSEDKEEIKFNLVAEDSLADSWQKIFPEVFRKNNGFDYVIGNPPYVRIQDLEDKSKEKLYQKWQTIGSGNYNLYFAFFELGMKILNPNGKLGYITPNNYFTSLAGFPLREYFSKNKQIIRILNFNHLKLFANASTYTCITLMKKNNKNNYFEYYYLENKEEISTLESIKFSKYHYEWLDDKKWRLMTEENYLNIKRIENIGLPLGKIFPIRVGIATLKDNVFFVEDVGNNFCYKEYNKKRYNIEKDITKKVIKISSINGEDKINNDARRIIFPYRKENGRYKLMDENELKSKFPKCYAYLLDAKEELMGRDKGKKDYPNWFAWGRTQGMDYKGPRLYTRTFYHKPHFMLDEEDNLFCNGYAVFCGDKKRAVQKILNSKIMEYYIKRTSVEIEGNYQCYQKNFIENFGIPNMTPEEWFFLENESQEVINNWLSKKYDLNVWSRA